MKKIKRNILLNPGPATTTDSVKYAQVVADICPREKEFGDLMEWISCELTLIVGEEREFVTILFGGSGTAVVEAIISSVVPRDKRVLIINNGAYGKRVCQIANAYSMDYIEFKSSEIEEINYQSLEEILAKEDNISHLVVIHNETTTGLLNDICRVGEICAKFGIEMIVDAMSSFGAIDIDMKRDNISFLASSSNKNLQGMAGVGFVVANKEAIMKSKKIPPRNFYLNLFAQYENFIKTHQMRFTPPVQTLYALKQAIIETKKEGVKNRYKRYSKSWERLIEGLEELNLKFLVDKKVHSKIITSIIEPSIKGYDFEKMHDYFYERGFTIYPGKVEGLNTFRVANIGEIDYKDIEEFLKLMRDYLKGL